MFSDSATEVVLAVANLQRLPRAHQRRFALGRSPLRFVVVHSDAVYARGFSERREPVLTEGAVPRWPFTDDDLRAMYAGGRGDGTARRFARFWAAVRGVGLMPRQWVTLEVPGRNSHRVTRFPLGMADWQGQWFLVSMLGDGCNWVQNVCAADGRVVLRRGRRSPCPLVEVSVSERPPIIKRYVQKVPGGRPQIPVDRDAPVDDFAAIADQYPVFRVEPRADV